MTSAGGGELRADLLLDARRARAYREGGVYVGVREVKEAGRTLSRLWWFPRLTPWPLMLPATRLGFRFRSFLSVLGSPIRPASTFAHEQRFLLQRFRLTLPYHSPRHPASFPVDSTGVNL